MQIRIKHILWCYQFGMSIRSIIFSLLVSRNTIKRDIRIYEDLGIDLERLLKMDEQHLHESFGMETDMNRLDLKRISAANICKRWANMVKREKHKVSLGITIKSDVKHTLNFLFLTDCVCQKRKVSV